ncbi:MAG: glycosyltransferase family 2 protein [bacterium]|nr:glycosyltransferase family 2 protein [bacterium]MCM1499442.1 glycosyltransferase family 2 protein [Clostridium sp.]
MKITILMPCLNEEKTLPGCIRKAKSFLTNSNYDGEVLVSDNGSTDRSVQIAKEAGARVIHVPTRGYGSALWGGILAAEGDYIIMGDADESYDFSALQPFIEKLDAGYELVMGNRFKGGIKPGAMPFLHRYIGNPLLSGLGRIFYKTNVGDFHCGLRAFKRDSIRELNLCTTGMEFASEMVVKAVLFGLKIAEVPVTLSPDGRDRAPHLRSFRDGWRHLKFLLLYSPNWLFLYPGIFFFIIGALCMTWLSFAPISIGGVSFEITTMFYCAMLTILGLSTAMFSLYTKIYAAQIGQIPQNSKINTFFEKIAYDYGIALGLACLLIGMGGVFVTLLLWGKAGFGSLE